MRKKETWFDLYCDGTGARITLKGVWTSTKKDAVFCQKHCVMVMTCEHCGREFHSERSHTKTCSNACRMAQSRAKRLQTGSVTDCPQVKSVTVDDRISGNPDLTEISGGYD